MTAETRAALFDFLDNHPGVQVWVEPATGFNKASILLVAGDGEWLRRNAAEPSARDFAKQAKLTCFTAGLDAYPQRMRDWDLREKD